MEAEEIEEAEEIYYKMIDLDHIIIDLEQIIMKKNKKYKEVMEEEEEEIEE